MFVMLLVFLAAAFPLSGQSPELELEAAVNDRILNNDYYMQSLRYTALARHSYENGDYDAATAYAEEAIRYAWLSDEYVSSRALSAAEGRLAWAALPAVNLPSRNPAAWRAAETAYAEAELKHSEERFGEAIAAANRVFTVLAQTSPARSQTAPPGPPPAGTFPARYTVRTWRSSGDCFWVIASRPWVYGDGNKWRLLYEANRNRLPRPNNPNFLEPGIVLEIPSLRGEVREGEWTPDRSWPSMR